MKAYELLYFINPSLDDEHRESVRNRIDAAITDQGGTIDNVDEWGKKKLAYEINKLTTGDYTLIEFHADPTAIAEIDRVLHIMDLVVRYKITRRGDREQSVEDQAD